MNRSMSGRQTSERASGQACVRSVLRAVDVVAQARRLQHASGVASAASASAQSLAKMLARAKTADVASLLDKANLKNLSFFGPEQSKHRGIACSSTPRKANFPANLPFSSLTSPRRRRCKTCTLTTCCS